MIELDHATIRILAAMDRETREADAEDEWQADRIAARTVPTEPCPTFDD